jgi:hypothetical protein
MCFEDLIKILSGLLTPFIACMAVYIAWQQYETSRHKFIFDLFEKRINVFYEVKSLLSYAFRDANLHTDMLRQFKHSTSDAEFLFGKEVVDYIDSIYEHGCKLLELSQILGSDIDSNKRSSAASKKTAEIDWLGEQFERSKTIFRPYIDFSNARFR